MTSGDKHLDTIRERFTITADAFADSVRTRRSEEASRLADAATAGLAHLSQALAIDVCCGPGTFTRPLANRVRHAIGVDLTEAMVEKARAEAALAGVSNIEFRCANIYAMPFDDGVADIVSCGYAVHHLQDPPHALAELVRVLRPGGRLAIMDIVVSEGEDAAAQNAIERVRDPSHTNTETVAQFRTLYKDAGLRIVSEETWDRLHMFDDWMRGAGSAPGDPTYIKTRGMIEDSRKNPLPAFRVRYHEEKQIEIMHGVILLVGEKTM